MKTETLLLLVGVGVGAYFLFKNRNEQPTAGTALGGLGGSPGGSQFIIDWGSLAGKGPENEGENGEPNGLPSKQKTVAPTKQKTVAPTKQKTVAPTPLGWEPSPDVYSTNPANVRLYSGEIHSFQRALTDLARQKTVAPTKQKTVAPTPLGGEPSPDVYSTNPANVRLYSGEIHSFQRALTDLARQKRALEEEQRRLQSRIYPGSEDYTPEVIRRASGEIHTFQRQLTEAARRKAQSRVASQTQLSAKVPRFAF